MNLKKFLLTIAVLSFCSFNSVGFANTSDNEVRNIINLYKAGNYTGCIESSNDVIGENPSNIFAYYYKGLAYTQLGKKDDATMAFNQVIDLNSNDTLVDYAKKANACISSPEDCEKYQKEVGELESFIKSNKFYSNSVQSKINQKRLDRMKENINDEINDQISNDKKSEMPSNDEIANAVKTLAKLGINPLANANANMINPQMMQMSMLMNDNSQAGYNMLPMLLMNQNGNQQVSPDLIQTMMMTQMSPAL